MSTKNFDGIAYTFVKWFDWRVLADLLARMLKAKGYYTRVIEGNSLDGKPGYKVFIRKV
jgi:hypothetical protein